MPVGNDVSGAFSAGHWGQYAGLCHDLGKYADAFQSYLRTPKGPEGHIEQSPGRVDHSTAGAQHAMETVAMVGRLVAYAIAGYQPGSADDS
ncbi:CRISPR-associated endonuclease Cas3'' [Aeoliella sp.]|uniref:CRISPR-associated endonuclease Cas3'' n=1 Tax=Aeoliella sp. TaxID=2795800 RepID=UPI003CCC2289